MSTIPIEFRQQFATQDDCLQYLFDLRHPNPACTACGQTNSFYRHQSKRCFTCSCGKFQVYPQQGTILEHSPLSVKLWFFALWLYWDRNRSMTIRDFQRALHVTYPTAWRMYHRIRDRTLETKASKTKTIDEYLERMFNGG